MADQSPEEIHLKHIRAPDYKEISADGTLHKIVDNHLVITFYIEDSRVTGEVLRRDGQDPPTYRIAAIEEEKQRLDVVAVRVPTKASRPRRCGRRALTQPPEKTPKAVKSDLAAVLAGLRQITRAGAALCPAERQGRPERGRCKMAHSLGRL
jgi:hypothetical protein